MATPCMNHVMLIGDLVSDPNWRNAPPMPFRCSLRVACRSRRRDPESGEWSYKPNYFDVTVWGPQAENAARFLCKGRSVAVAGRLEWREEEGRDGERRQFVEVVAKRLQYLDRPSPTDDNTGGEVVSMASYRSSKRKMIRAEASDDGLSVAGNGERRSGSIAK
jgi:single-strand DNA-binding protein